MSLVETGVFDELRAIIFCNHGRGDDHEVVICETEDVFQEELARLKTMKHIEVLKADKFVVRRAGR